MIYAPNVLTFAVLPRQGTRTASTVSTLVQTAEPTAAVQNEARLNELAPTLETWVNDKSLLQPPRVFIPRFAWRGFITLYSAPDKGGKSTLLTAGCAAVSRGDAFLDGDAPDEPVRTLWVCLEEHQGTLVQRFQLYNAHMNNVRIMAYPPNAREDLREAVELWKPDVVVIDTLVRYAEGSVKLSGDAQQWAGLMKDFIVLARTNHCAVIVLHHARRSDGQSRDSGDITSASDMVIEQKGRPKNGIQKFTVRSRIQAEDFEVRLHAGVHEICSSSAESKDEDIAAVLAHVVRQPKCSGEDIRHSKLGISNKRIEVAFKALRESGRIRNDGTQRTQAWVAV